MRWIIIGSVVAGCYSPNTSPGSPCDPGPCPSGLVCSPASHTCERTVIDAAVDVSMMMDTPDAPAGAWLPGYMHRKRITVTNTTTATLAQFPVSIVFASDPDLASSDGSDIVFTGGDAEIILPSEIVAFGPGGALDAWVQLSLAPGANTLFMYWGGLPATRTSPWGTQYAGVWHMSGSGSTEHDSASAHDVAAVTTITTPTSTTGIVGGARLYDGVDDSMSVADPSDGSLDFGTASFSYSVWVDVTTSAGPFDIPLWKGGSSLPEPGYDMELGTSAWNGGISDMTSVYESTYGNEGTLLGRWVQLTTVVDRAAGRLRSYVDGVLVTSTAITGAGTLSNASPLQLGNPGNPFKGVLDEVRIYTRALTPAWIAAEHDNLANRSSTFIIGPLETR